MAFSCFATVAAASCSRCQQSEQNIGTIGQQFLGVVAGLRRHVTIVELAKFRPKASIGVLASIEHVHIRQLAAKVKPISLAAPVSGTDWPKTTFGSPLLL
jgi:hypothetical protein